MKKKVLITGGSGYLGQFLIEALALQSFDDVDIYLTYHKKVIAYYDSSKQIYMDISDDTSIIACISSLQPNVIIHLAAVSSLAVCNSNADEANKCNCPSTLIDAVKEYCPDCLFVFSSTDLIYGSGEHPPYKATSNNSFEPMNVYGITKLGFERQVLQLTNGIVLRLSNMISTTPYVYEDVGCKFLQFLQQSMDSKAFIGLRCDEVRSFVCIKDVVQVLLSCIASALDDNKVSIHAPNINDIKGKIFNIGGPEGLSRLDLASILAKHQGIELNILPTHIENNTDIALISTGNIWNVYSQKNAECNISTGIKSPRDVTMDITETELVFNIKFKTMSDTITQ